MTFRIAVSFLLLAAALLFGLPASVASSQHLFEEGVRVIALSATGSERANAVAYSPDGERIAVGTSSGILIFNAETLEQERFIDTGSWVRSLAFSADGSSLAGGLFDHTARLWRTIDGTQLQLFEGHTEWVRSLALSPDGGLLVTASDDHSVRLWNVNDGSQQLVLDRLEGVRILALSPDGLTLAVGLQDNTIQLRQVSDGGLLRTLDGHTAWVRSLAFSPNGQILASGAFDATARLWDVESGQPLYTLAGHRSSVLGVSFSPDGSTLATGSVDRTVRLWKVRDGSLERILAGHEGFVYSVAFAPDGRTLASGSQDNTVRLWDLNTIPPGPVDVPATPSDCRACHHPMSSTSAPAVIEVRCDVCHVNGIGLNWCPYFTRSPGAAIVPEVLPVLDESAGVPIAGDSLGVIIFSPANGETIYSHSEYVSPFKVTGRVMSTDSSNEVEVRLDVWSGSELVFSLQRQPDPGGDFEFLLGVNPAGHMLIINDPAAPLNCAACHDDFNVQAYLSAGDFRMTVTAIAPDGTQAVDERWITVDVSGLSTLDILVREDGSGKPLNGLTVQASTRLYDWRGRVQIAVSDPSGSATLAVETLSQAFTEYEIVVPDQVVDGVLYSSTNPEAIKLDPKSTSEPQVTVAVHAQRGSISGSLTGGGDLSNPIPVWAFRMPVGPVFQTEIASDSSFSFTEIPVAEYLVYPDPAITGLSRLGWEQQSVDLTRSPASNVQFELVAVKGSVVKGKVAGQNGEWLPFAWLTSVTGESHQVDFGSGTWTMAAEGQWTVSAPGYYSQKIMFSEDAPTSILLEPSADTQRVPWGEGEIVIPGETQASFSEERLTFQSGWIWGNGQDAQPLRIDTPEMEIVLHEGQFALQGLPEEIAWLILLDGQAELRSKRTGEVRSLLPGSLTALSRNDDLVSMPYEPALQIALGIANRSPISPSWKPGTMQRIQEELAKAGVGTAQMVTFITYIIAISSLGVAPLTILLWWWKRRKTDGEEHDKIRTGS